MSLGYGFIGGSHSTQLPGAFEFNRLNSASGTNCGTTGGFQSGALVVRNSEFNGMSSAVGSNHDGYMGNNRATDGASGADQAPGTIHVAFGNGNNQQLPFEPQGHFKQRGFNYNAVDAHNGRAACKGSSLASRAVRKTKAFVSSILGKRSAPSPVSDTEEHVRVSTELPHKKRRNNNGESIKIIATTSSSDDEEPWELVNYSKGNFHGLSAIIGTNTNDVWQRPQRKEWVGVWSYVQRAEDKTWTVDPHTGARIPYSG